MKTLASVIVVAYNNWPDLELAVESALCQSHRELEVIVVDNSSADATPVELPRRFGGRITVVRQSNRGDAGAYNAGLRLARGEFIQFLDGDDVLAPNKIEAQVAALCARPGADIAHGDVRNFQSLPAYALVADHETRDYADMFEAALSTDARCLQSPLCALFRRGALERVGPWDETVYCTDFDYWLRAAWLGCRFLRVPGVMGFSRLRPGQMSDDEAAMRRGAEATLVKALGYVDRQPQRRLVEDALARHRFMTALSDGSAPRAAARKKLRQARGAVSPLAYAAGLAAVTLPGGRWAARSPRLGGLRRLLARAARFRAPGF